MNKALFLFLPILLLACNKQNNTTQKTNVILIMTDDQGWRDFGINGNDSIHTPNLDQLSREGVSFDRFFVSPLCASTRASLLTGVIICEQVQVG